MLVMNQGSFDCLQVERAITYRVWIVIYRMKNVDIKYKRQEMLTLREHLGSFPIFGWLSVFCVMLFVFVLCFVYPMLLVSLDCPFVMRLSVFSNVY
jgi:hypothetical protein